jgi:hypothetical protein
MALTRIENNQISNAVSGNAELGINGNLKLQEYTVTGTRLANNLSYGSSFTATGNITGGNLLTAGQVSATGNITTGGYFLGNIACAQGYNSNSIFNGTSNVLIGTANGNISMDVNATANVVVVTSAGINLTGVLSASGNVTSQNFFTAGTVSATGDVYANNTRTSNVISSGQLSLSTASNGNILIQPNGSGNIILANTYINSVAYPVQDQDAASKVYVDNLVSTAISYHEAVYVATNTDLATATGGTVTYAQPNGAGNGIGATLTTTGSFNLIDTGNVQTAGTRILVKDEANAAHNGVYVWSNSTVITRSSDTNTYGVGNADAMGLNDYFFVQDGNVNQGSAWIVDAPTGTITFGTSNIQFAQFSQSQVYSANTNAGISLIGQTFSAKVDNDTTAFDGGGNIIVKAGANLTTPNIGAATGISLSLTGNATSGNVLTGGEISATGTAYAGNFNTSGIVSATGNIIGANVFTGGSISATGNLQSGNVLTGGLVSATGNITGNYILGNGSQLANTGQHFRFTNVNAANYIVDGVYNDPPISLIRGQTYYFDMAAGSTHPLWIKTAPTLGTGNAYNTGVTNNGINSGQITFTVPWDAPNLLYYQCQNHVGMGGYLQIVDGTMLQNGNSTVTVYGNGNVSTQVSNVANVTVVTATGLNVTGTISATGDITGGNIYFGSGVVSGTGNVYGSNFVGNVVGNITGNIDAAGSNTEVQFNDGGILGASSGFTFDSNGNVLTANGNINGANLFTGGQVSATGNIITAGYFLGNIACATGYNSNTIYNGTSNVLIATANGNITMSVDGTPNVVVVTSSTLQTNNLSASGNAVIDGNLVVNGNLVYVNVTDLNVEDPIIGLGRGANNAPLTSDDGKDRGEQLWYYSGSEKSAFTGYDNSAGKILLATDVTITNEIVSVNNYGNLVIGNLEGASSTVTGTATAGNVLTGGVVSATGTGTFGNVATGGTISATGTATAGNVLTGGIVSATGNITGNYFFGNGSQLTGIDTTLISNGNSNVQVYANSNVAVSITGTSNTVVFTSSGVSAVGNVTGNTYVLGADAVFGTSYSPTTGATITVNATDSILFPVGNTAQRPTGATGMVRFNTTENQLEVYNGTTWVGAGGEFTVIADDQFAGDGSTVTFVLSSSQTTDSCIVSINGVVQIPTSAYSVSGTNLTFTEAPAAGDDIDVRTLTTTTTVTGISNSPGNAAVSVSDTSNVVSVTGAVSATGNITGNYFIGNGSLLTGIDATVISNGTANVRTFLNGNVATSAGGNANVFLVTSTGAVVTGDLTVTGNATITGNVVSNQISNGTSAVQIPTLNGNVNIDVGAVDNLAVFTTGGMSIVGTVTANGNITGGNVLTSGLISATSTITSAANITGGNILTAGIMSSTGNGIHGNVLTGGLISATGNITGGNLSAGTGTLTIGNIVNANGNGVGNIGSSTTYFNTVFAKATSAQYADLAEKYTADADYAPGTVVMFGGSQEITICVADGSSRVAGVISTNPSYIMNGTLEGAHVATVALTGRVPTKVTGTVRKGDLMVSAGNGLARAEANPGVGTVIGKALADHDGADGVIEVVVGRF